MLFFRRKTKFVDTKDLYIFDTCFNKVGLRLVYFTTSIGLYSLTSRHKKPKKKEEEKQGEKRNEKQPKKVAEEDKSAEQQRENSRWDFISKLKNGKISVLSNELGTERWLKVCSFTRFFSSFFHFFFVALAVARAFAKSSGTPPPPPPQPLLLPVRPCRRAKFCFFFCFFLFCISIAHSGILVFRYGDDHQ